MNERGGTIKLCQHGKGICKLTFYVCERAAINSLLGSFIVDDLEKLLLVGI